MVFSPTLGVGDDTLAPREALGSVAILQLERTARLEIHLFGTSEDWGMCLNLV